MQIFCQHAVNFVTQLFTVSVDRSVLGDQDRAAASFAGGGGGAALGLRLCGLLVPPLSAQRVVLRQDPLHPPRVKSSHGIRRGIRSLVGDARARLRSLH